MSVAGVDPFDNSRFPASIDLAIRNESGTAIASAVFEASFFDLEGSVRDTVRQKVIDLAPNTGRGFAIASLKFDESIVGYRVRLIRANTSDVEKVQVRRHNIRTTETGDEEVSGMVKNLGSVAADAAVVVSFFDAAKENIGTKAVVLTAIEPGSTRQYFLTFRPQEGDKVSSFSVSVGEIGG